MSSVINTSGTHGLFHILKLNNEQKTNLKGRNSENEKISNSATSNCCYVHFQLW